MRTVVPVPRHRNRLQNAGQSRSKRLAAYGFELSEARELIASAGARTEISIKTAILPHLPPKEDLDGCINALKTVGVTFPSWACTRHLREMKDFYSLHGDKGDYAKGVFA
jgi:hypothetical protein